MDPELSEPSGSTKKLLLEQTVKSVICENLTFQEALKLREALSVISLDCLISVTDRLRKKVILPGVNESTARIYSELQRNGLLYVLEIMFRNEKGINSPHFPILIKTVLLNLNYQDGDWTPVTMIVKEGMTPVLRYLLDRKLINVNEDYTKRNLGTALSAAVFRNNPEIVKLLIAHGANVNYPSPFSKTAPIMWAARMGYDDVIQILLENGADVNAKNSNGTTALITAAYIYPKTVELLLKWGADVNVVDVHGTTALSAAQSRQVGLSPDRQEGRKQIVNMLLSAGAVH